MKAFKKAERCLLAQAGWQRAPRLTVSLCCGCPWGTFCNTGPQLSSPWWSIGDPSLSGCPHAMGCSGALWRGWPGDIHVLGCGCAAVLALPAVIQLQFSKHGALLPFVAASQHDANPVWLSIGVCGGPALLNGNQGLLLG